jgi:hypothetical protein
MGGVCRHGQITFGKEREKMDNGEFVLSTVNENLADAL